MSRPAGFSVLRSSAGAGKTHALSKRWLRLALREAQPEAYRRVLAITFTNKAANELKDRVVRRLRALAEGKTGDAAIDDIRAELRSAETLDDATIAARAQAVFHHVLHHWGDLAITTIDAFTRRVVKPFARDLRLDGDLEMTTEQADYHRRAVDRLLLDAGRDADLTALLTQLSFNLVDDEDGWRPDLRLLGLAGELDKGATIAHLPLLEGIGAGELLRVEAEARQKANTFQHEVRRMGREALRMVEEHDIDRDDFKHGARGLPKFLNDLANFDGELAIGAYARKLFEGTTWHKDKADVAVQERIAAVRGPIEQIYARVQELEPEFRKHAIRAAVLRGLLPTAALREIDERLEDLKREDGVSFFSDLTRKASGELRDEPPDFIFERIGERYQHLMIDEFQDTSLLQWAALLPLVENVLGNGGSVQLVGDAKQAIYRWRDGEARLFSSFPGLFGKSGFPDGERKEKALRAAHLPTEPLHGNFRSGSAIVAFNNSFFTACATLLPEGELRRIYDGLEQHAHSAHAGFVELRTFPARATRDENTEPTEEEEVKENLRLAAATVRNCLADGFVPGDIAILVRGRTTAAAIAGHFEKEGIPVFSNDGLLIGKDPEVALVIDLLRYLHIGEADAAARIAQRLRLKGDLTLAHTADEDAIEAVRDWTRSHPRLGAHHPLEELVVDLVAAIGSSPVRDPYLMTLLDEVHGFVQHDTGGIPSFLAHWERSGRDRSVKRTGGASAVNLLTIHKSKGLEFPVVIVPDTAMGSVRSSNERVWIDPRDALPEVPAALVPLRAVADHEVPEAGEVARLQRLDELNLLYVAFTRAVQRLYAFVPSVKTITAEKRERDPFTCALLDLISDQGAAGVYLFGEAAAPWERERTDVAMEAVGDAGGIASPVKVKIREEAPTDWDPADPDPYRSHGERVHAIMARLRTIDDLPGVLRRAVASNELDPRTADALGSKLGTLLSRADVAVFFREDIESLTETTLIDRHGRAHRPDRVVRDGGTLRVLDIKTGAPAGHHHDQVHGYMRLLAEVEGVAVSGHLLYLATGELVAVE